MKFTVRKTKEGYKFKIVKDDGSFRERLFSEDYLKAMVYDNSYEQEKFEHGCKTCNHVKREHEDSIGACQVMNDTTGLCDCEEFKQ